MALVVTDEGCIAILQAMFAGVALDPYLALFQNDVTPDHSFSLGSFLEATFPGYARIHLGFPGAITPAIGGGANAQWGAGVFTSTGPAPGQTMFGYFVVANDALGTPRCIWCERPSPSIDFSLAGSSVTVFCNLSDGSLFG